MPLFNEDNIGSESEKAIRAAKRELDLALRPSQADYEGNRSRVEAAKEAKKRAKQLKKQQRRAS